MYYIKKNQHSFDRILYDKKRDLCVLVLLTEHKINVKTHFLYILMGQRGLIGITLIFPYEKVWYIMRTRLNITCGFM